MTETHEWLPIAQAAQQLGIAERQARRYAAKLPDSDRTVDRTPAGRERALVRLSALSKVMEEVRARTPAPDTDRSDDRTPAGQSVGIAVAYEGVIKEQAARIADLQAALEHERAQAQRLTEALAREQTLRALEGPRPAPVSFWERLWGKRQNSAHGSGTDRVE